ncbi:MAG TPA: YIP1 family protein [Acidimicrobiia bacterium]|nr:YIP1 family protein [Acidimicrobiia bacterium]
MFSRAGRAAILDRKPFTEAYFDGDSAADAAILVALVAAITYVGRLLITGAIGAFSLPGLLESVIAGVVSWLILGFASWFAATRLFQSTGRPQTFIALQGLAVLPLVLELFGRIGGGIGLIWYLVILGVGTREAANIDTRNAAVSVLIGFAIAAIFRTLLGVPFVVFSALF